MVEKKAKAEKQKVATGISPGVGAMENYVMEVPETPKTPPTPPTPPPKLNKFKLILIILLGILTFFILIAASIFLAALNS